jgi:hypothetical protein
MILQSLLVRTLKGAATKKKAGQSQHSGVSRDRSPPDRDITKAAVILQPGAQLVIGRFSFVKNRLPSDRNPIARMSVPRCQN